MRRLRVWIGCDEYEVEYVVTPSYPAKLTGHPDDRHPGCADEIDIVRVAHKSSRVIDDPDVIAAIECLLRVELTDPRTKGNHP